LKKAEEINTLCIFLLKKFAVKSSKKILKNFLGKNNKNKIIFIIFSSVFFNRLLEYFNILLNF